MKCNMVFMELRKFSLLLAVSSLAACTAEDSLTSTSQSVTTWNRLSSNRLSSNRLSSNRLALDPHGASGLLATDDGRNVLSYIVSCAIDQGQSLEASGIGSCSANADCGSLWPGTCVANKCNYSFPGLLDLAPEWLDEPLDSQGQGWVSACLFARVNAHDTAESISLHGEYPSLTLSIDEAALYTVEEGAFYGNIFLNVKDESKIQWYACRGEGQAAGEFGGLVDRDCAEPAPGNPEYTQCGFHYAGDCADYTPLYPSPYACEERETGDPATTDDGEDQEGEHHGNHGDHGDHDRDHHHVTPPTPAVHGVYYEGCHATSGLGTWSAHNRRFGQVITTFVTP
jgi:hypothetical protein